MTIHVMQPKSSQDRNRIYRFLYEVWSDEFCRCMDGMDHVIQPGEPFGEVRGFGAGRRTADIVALEKSTACLMPDDFPERWHAPIRA